MRKKTTIATVQQLRDALALLNADLPVRICTPVFASDPNEGFFDWDVKQVSEEVDPDTAETYVRFLCVENPERRDNHS